MLWTGPLLTTPSPWSPFFGVFVLWLVNNSLVPPDNSSCQRSIFFNCGYLQLDFVLILEAGQLFCLILLCFAYPAFFEFWNTKVSTTVTYKGNSVLNYTGCTKIEIKLEFYSRFHSKVCCPSNLYWLCNVENEKQISKIVHFMLLWAYPISP